MDAAEDSPLPQDLVFVDLETTGGNAAHHRITEVGIVRVRNGVLLEEWSTLVNPQCRIPPSIEAFTGISNEMVAAAPRFADVAALVFEKLQDAIFVAHNARFDYSFLRSEFRRLERRFAAKVLCTVRLSRLLYPGEHRHGLDAVMQRHGLTCTARHRALGDARVLWEFWRKLQDDFTAAQLGAAVGRLLGAGRLPAHLPPELADELPDGPGVYCFYGEADALLYVGKSNSLRTRVLAHFGAEHTDSKEQKLSRQVRRVEWLETAGELGALLREAQWVRTHKPLYNRRLKGNAEMHTIRTESGRAGFVPVDELDPVELPQCFGLFRSRREAGKALGDIARAQGLCLKILGIEDGPGSCFGHQLGRCRGACVGKEPQILHDMRVQLALSSLKLKSWPFPGRIALRETNWRGEVDLHVCENWAYLGTARDEEELEALRGRSAPPQFDADVYRILVRYFAARHRPDWIELRQPTICP